MASVTYEEQLQIGDAVSFITENMANAEQRKARIDKYAKLQTVDVAVLRLIMFVHDIFPDDTSRRDFYIGYIFCKFNVSSSETITIRRTVSQTIELNHDLVKSTITEFCASLNSLNVDYYLIGSIPCYLRIKNTFLRYHDDLDIMVNEADLEKLRMLFQNTDYTFRDKRFDNINYYNVTTKQVYGEHELIAYHKTQKFHIGFYIFIRGENGEFIRRQYFQEVCGCHKITKICDRASSYDYTCANYGVSPFQYEQISFRTESLDGIYNSKKREREKPGREKDYYDMAMIETSGMLNQNKLELLQNQWEMMTPHIRVVTN